jgi:hypothetical protein
MLRHGTVEAVGQLVDVDGVGRWLALCGLLVDLAAEVAQVGRDGEGMGAAELRVGAERHGLAP